MRGDGPSVVKTKVVGLNGTHNFSIGVLGIGLNPGELGTKN